MTATIHERHDPGPAPVGTVEEWVEAALLWEVGQRVPADLFEAHAFTVFADMDRRKHVPDQDHPGQ